MAGMDRIAVARAFAAALDLGDDEAAAALMAPGVRVVLQGGRTVEGREAWLAGRRAQPPAEHMEERFEDVAFVEVEGGVELRGRLVQRWRETGEPAHEQPLQVLLEVEDGLVRSLELRPGA